MKKKLLTLLLVALVIFSVTGCSIDFTGSGDASGKTGISKESDEDEKESKKDKKEKDSDKKSEENKKEDKSEKDSKKDSKDNSKEDKKEKGDSEKTDDSTEIWYVDDEAIFTIEDESEYDEYVSTNFYDKEKGTIHVCDYDGREIIELNVPEGFAVTFASDKGAAFDLNNKSKSYDEITVDYKESLYLADYLRDGAVPSGSDISDYKAEYKEYKIDGTEFIIATEEYYYMDFEDKCKYYYILYPYMDGDIQEYVSLSFVVERNREEFEKLAKEMLGIN